jgi:arylsulfatase A-like enzyme
MPACVPARTSLMTGRWPGATRVRTNHNVKDAFYEKDLVDVLKKQGYATALCGKNHSYLTPERFDHWLDAMHDGIHSPERTQEEWAFDGYLAGLHHRADTKPAPFPLHCQIPYRCVSNAQQWVESVQGRPFFLWLSFPEPHNPYQVPEPYFSMFQPEKLPPTRTGAGALAVKGFKFRHTRMLAERAYPDFAATLGRARANYHGMLRLIDDQVKRFVTFLEEKKLRENTILVFLSDHGDFAGEYGLMRKGPELPDCLTRVPMIWTGPGIQAGREPALACVSLADVMPTLCEALGVPIPRGVQGRSLWPMLTGGNYPQADFETAYVEQGFGGLHYNEQDTRDPVEEGALQPGVSYDELNSWTQSGTMRMARKGDWKLIFDMMGNGQLYNLASDPAEMHNLYGNPEYAAKQQELMAELLSWVLRAQDPLPYPRSRYRVKTAPRNYFQGKGED